MTEDVEDDGAIALAKLVVEDGADVGSSREMKCAPSSALSRSSVFAFGRLSGGATGGSTGGLSDHGAFSGGCGVGTTRGRREGEGGGTEGAVPEVAFGGELACAYAMLSSYQCAGRAGGGRDCLAGEPDIGPARRDGCMLLVGRGGICGVKSSVSAGCDSCPCAERGGAGTANTSCDRTAGDGVCRLAGGISPTLVWIVP